jgi:hypothetical protein
MKRFFAHSVHALLLIGGVVACYSGPTVTREYAGASNGAEGSDADGGTGTTGTTCATGLTACGQSCVDAKIDPANCGKCSNACGAGVCSNGACLSSCPAPTTNCSGSCVDTSTSSENCGGCGKPCSGGKACTSGACSCGATPALATLQDILTRSCATTGCHAGARPAENLLLTAGNSYAELVNVPSSCSGKMLVVPGAADQSYLMNKLTGAGMCTGSVMPKKGAELSASQIDLFRAWICNGAPNK